MKKPILKPMRLPIAMLVVWAMASCSGNGDLALVENSLSNETNFRSIEDAIKIAEEARDLFDMPASRSASSLSLKNVYTVYSSSSRSKAAPILYVINHENNEGFTIVNPNLTQEPLIAITEQGALTDISDIENPGLKIYINDLLSFLEEDREGAESLSLLDSGNVPMIWVKRDTVVEKVNPRVMVRWGQHTPEGFFCPNGISGCVMTAAAQAMSYFGEPAFFNYTFQGVDIPFETVNWAALKLYVTSLSQFTNWMDTTTCRPENLTLARICREIGKRIQTAFGDNAVVYESYTNQILNRTGAHIENLRPIMSNMLPGHEVSQMYDYAPNPRTLSIGGIIIMSGETNAQEGHTWIIDGYKHLDITVSYYEVTKPEITMIGTGEPRFNELIRQEFESKTYSHVNWGYNGESNGYFLSSNYTTSAGQPYDVGVTHVWNFNYNSNKRHFIIR